VPPDYSYFSQVFQHSLLFFCQRQFVAWCCTFKLSKGRKRNDWNGTMRMYCMASVFLDRATDYCTVLVFLFGDAVVV
jgi:hypothetical protein